MSSKPVLLGIQNGKEYYLCPADKNHSEPYICWLVPDIREGIRAMPGWKILGADYSQIEVRIMAWESQDEWLIAALNSGKDIHCYMAADVHKVDYDEFYYAYKHEEHPLHNKYYGWRSEIKTTTFGVPYGAGPAQVAKQINSGRKPNDPEPSFTEDNARALIDSYFSKATGLAKWLKKKGLWALAHGESKSIGGHYRFYQMPLEENKDYEERIAQIKRWAGNHPIQCLVGTSMVFEKTRGYVSLQSLSGLDVELWDGHIFSKAFVVPSGKKQITNLRFMNGLEIQSSPDHRFSVLTTKNKRTWKKCKELISKNLRVELTQKVPEWHLPLSIPSVPPGNSWNFIHRDIATISNLNELGELLGRLASNGSVGKANLVWLVAEHELVIKPRLESIIKKLGHICEDINKKEGYAPVYRLTINSVSLAKQLTLAGIKCRVPPFIWRDSTLLKAYLRGMFDGDGTCNTDNVVLTFGKQKYKWKWALEIQQALLLLGIRSRVRHYDGDRTVVAIQKYDTPIFAKEIGFINPSKQSKALQIKGTERKGVAAYDKGVSIRRNTPTDKYIEMYDVINSETNQFMANGLVVHNSGCADMLKMAVGKIYLDLRGGISNGPLIHPAHFILFVHDELVLTAEDSSVEAVKQIMIDGMQWAYENLIGLKNIIHETDVVVADYWRKG